MAHTLFTAEEAAKATIASLRWLSNLPRTVRQDFSNEFVAGRGQTVNVRGPINAGKANVYTKANRANRDAIQTNDLTETWIPVTLEDQVYNAVRLPDDFATFTLKDMTKQVLVPQAKSVVDEMATPLVAEMTGIGSHSDVPKIEIVSGKSNIRSVLIQARKVLNDRHVPQSDRFFAVGSEAEAIALEDELLQKVNESGTSETLRNATLGRLFGFTIIADPALPDDFAIAYQRDAFAHVTRPSKQPAGAAFSATVAQDGFALRWIQHYNPMQLEDQSVVDAFYGAKTLDARFAVSASTSEAPPAPGEPEDPED